MLFLHCKKLLEINTKKRPKLKRKVDKFTAEKTYTNIQMCKFISVKATQVKIS